MTQTPEGRVKQKIKQVLKDYGVYYEMPVPGGYGKSGLDFVCCYQGIYISIEAKRPDGVATHRQQQTIVRIREAGGLAFVVASEEMGPLRRFFDALNGIQLVKHTAVREPEADGGDAGEQLPGVRS